jgi:hypothetical protein
VRQEGVSERERAKGRRPNKSDRVLERGDVLSERERRERVWANE